MNKSLFQDNVHIYRRQQDYITQSLYNLWVKENNEILHVGSF